MFLQGVRASESMYVEFIIFIKDQRLFSAFVLSLWIIGVLQSMQTNKTSVLRINLCSRNIIHGKERKRIVAFSNEILNSFLKRSLVEFL